MERRTTGMTRKIDDLGRLVLPIEIRRAFGLAEGDTVEISVNMDSIILQKVKDCCIICNSDADLTKFQEKSICLICRKALMTEM